MSSSDLLKRIKELEAKTLQNKPGSTFDKVDADYVSIEKENSKPIVPAPSSSKQSQAQCKKFLHFYEHSPPDSGCISEYATCSNSVPSTASMKRIAISSYTNLPSIRAEGSLQYGSRNNTQNESAAKSHSVNGRKVLKLFQSDSALRNPRSTSVDSPHQKLVRNSVQFGGSVKNVGQNLCERRRRTSPQNPEVQINGRSYIVLGSLGSGGSSKVYQVLDRSDNKLCALKCVDLLRTDGGQKEAYLNEIQLLKRLSHTGCVIKLYDHEIRKHYLYILMEKGDIDLASFLKTQRKEINDPFIRYYWGEMLKCVAVIHKEGIVHLDLKPANFLFVKGALKLIDFGIASALPSNKTSVLKETQMGTLSYMAPEVIKGTCGNGVNDGDKQYFKINRKADVWSLGCILYNMVYGSTPFQHYRSLFEKANAIINQPVNFAAIDDKDLLDVMKRCLEKDPQKRASVDELLNHEYVKGKRRATFDQSVMLNDDDDFIKFAEDLRQISPTSCARKLRSLMLKSRNADRSQPTSLFRLNDLPERLSSGEVHHAI